MGIDLQNMDWNRTLIYLTVVVVSISVHEFAHALAADRLGDDLPRRQGRLTLLPTEHFDPLGFAMIVWMALGGWGLGWGKPVQVNPGALRHPRRDMIIIAGAGPFSNLCMALVVGLAIRFVPLDAQQGMTWRFLDAFFQTNLLLMLFNLFPIVPLDGSKVLANLLPFDQSVKFDRVMGQYALFMIIGLLIVLRSQPMLLSEPQMELMRLITGYQYG